MKTCSKCCKLLSLEYFSKSAKSKDGLKYSCKECDKALNAKWYTDNRDHKNAYRSIWYVSNKDKCKKKNDEWRRNNVEREKAKVLEWRTNNVDKFSAYVKRWRVENRDKCAAVAAMRHAIEEHATPPWLTDDHMKQIRIKYEEAKRVSEETGVKHHVDHVFPLRGETFCGLHVPWNLEVITQTLNCSKRNKYPRKYRHLGWGHERY